MIYMLEEPEKCRVSKFDNSAVVIKGQIRPNRFARCWQVAAGNICAGSSSLLITPVLNTLPHQTLYFREGSKPFELALLEQLKREKTG